MVSTILCHTSDFVTGFSAFSGYTPNTADFQNRVSFLVSISQVPNSCPNMLFLISLVKLSWTPEGAKPGSAMNIAENCLWKLPLPFWVFWPLILFTMHYQSQLTDVSAWKLAAYKLTLFSGFMLLHF